MLKFVLLVHAAATLYMVGLIWFVQVVHYPLFDGVGAGGFAEYETRHARRTTWVVLPPMVVELATAVWLVAQRDALGSWWGREGAGGLPWVGLGALLMVWAVTFGLSVPQHVKLAGGFDAGAHRVLTETNWLRTAGWTVRGGVVLWMLGRGMRP
ncbi:MAG: hypothetical protein AAGG38_13975 [Planctomycetota bacterium]